jgi:hypothetical protein
MRISEEKITLIVKKKNLASINGKFNDIGTANLVITYLRINLQNVKINKKYQYILFKN